MQDFVVAAAKCDAGLTTGLRNQEPKQMLGGLENAKIY